MATFSKIFLPDENDISGFFSVLTLSKNDENNEQCVFLVITLSNDFLFANLLHAARIITPKARVRRKIAGSLF